MSTVEEAALARLEEELAAHRKSRLVQLAEEEQARRDRDAAEAAAAAEQERANHASNQADMARKEAFEAVCARLAGLGEAVGRFVSADVAAQDAAQAAGRKLKSLRETAAERIVVELRDRGLTCDPIPFVHSMWGNRLRERFPLVVADAVSEPRTPTDPSFERRCGICRSESRAAVDEALLEGATLRTVEEQFGFSRSTLSRHYRRHSGGNP
jgi:hypothetical protein